MPDTGHILRGHEDILGYPDEPIRTASAICISRTSMRTANGPCLARVCDTPAVIDIVAAAPRFNGWLVLEEESDTAAADPATAVQTNRETMRRYGA